VSFALQADLREALTSAATAQGFQRSRWVHSSALPEAIRRHPQVDASGRGSFLIVALSCFRREADDPSSPGEPLALLAPFARRNYYREAVYRLKRAASRALASAGVHDSTRAGILAVTGLRVFANSRFPEKTLAAAAGLGFLGANSLVIAPGLGSLFVIAGLFVPGDLGSDPPLPDGQEPGGRCGSCRACREACPLGALPEPGRLDRARCLQALATVTSPWPAGARQAWSCRLYGCQVCQEVCPFNRELALETETERGALGPGVPLRRLLAGQAPALKQALRGTVLDRSWIPGEALLRNSLLAAGHRRDPAVLDEVRARGRDESPLVREAAAWAEKAILRG
jgi:epoxyqueuosine reductase